MAWTAGQLRQRIEFARAAGERLDKVDYIGRLWLADYAADIGVIGDCLEELLNQGVALTVDPFATENAALFARNHHIPMGGC